MKDFIEFQFGCCPLVGDKLMQEQIIKSSLRAVYSDEISPLESWQKVSQKLCIKETLRH